MALRGSLEFGFKLIYRNLEKAGNFPYDTCSCHFSPIGYNLNELGRRPVVDAKHQISMFCDLQLGHDFTCFPYISLCKTCIPGACNII